MQAYSCRFSLRECVHTGSFLHLSAYANCHRAEQDDESAATDGSPDNGPNNDESDGDSNDDEEEDEDEEATRDPSEPPPIPSLRDEFIYYYTEPFTFNVAAG